MYLHVPCGYARAYVCNYTQLEPEPHLEGYGGGIALHIFRSSPDIEPLVVTLIDN